MKRLLTVLPLLVCACGQQAVSTPRPLPARVIPPAIAGFTASEEKKAEGPYHEAGPSALVDRGEVFALHQQGVVRGILQVAVFKRQYDDTDIKLRHQVRSSIGSGHFKYYRVDGQWVGQQDRPDLRLFIWFPAGQHDFEVLAVRNDVDSWKELLVAVVRYQHGKEVA